MSNKLKVAFINQPLDHVLPPHQNSIGIWTYQVARRITDRCEVTAYAKLMHGETDKVEYDGQVCYKFIRMAPIRAWDKFGNVFSRFYTTQKPLFAAGFYYYDFILPIAVDVRRKKFDIVHIHNFTQFVPVVRSLNPSATIVLHMNGEWLSQLDRAMMAGRIAKADLILGSSDHIRDLARQRFPEFSNKIQTVYNGVDTDHFVPEDLSSPHHKTPQKLHAGTTAPIPTSNYLGEEQTNTHWEKIGENVNEPVDSSSSILAAGAHKVVEVTDLNPRTLPPSYEMPDTGRSSVDISNTLKEKSELRLGNAAPDAQTKRDDVLLFVGRISPEKGIHVLIDAFSLICEQCPNTKLLIVGPEGEIAFEYLVGLSNDPKVAALAEFYDGTHPEPSYAAHLRQRIPNHLRDRVVFTGPIAQKQLIEKYYQADILVNPSFSESFGMSLAEAMACEKPVVASRVGGMKSIVEDGKTGYLVTQGDPQSLASAILDLLQQPEKRTTMGEAGRSRSLALFSWNQVSQDWLALVGEYNEYGGIRTSAL